MTFDPSDILTGIVGLLGGGSVATVIAGVAAFFLGRAFNKKPAASANPDVQRLAFAVESADLKRVGEILDAIATNNRAALGRHLDYIQERSKDEGGVRWLFEPFVHTHVPELLGDPSDRPQLYEVISRVEGVNVQQLVDEAKAKRAGVPAAAVVAPVVAILLCLAIANPAAAGGWAPERWEPTIEQPVIDAPLHREKRASGGSVYAELGYPGYRAPASYGACGRGGFWQRGPARRGLSFAARVLTWPFRR
jgi:hypothetical protein